MVSQEVRFQSGTFAEQEVWMGRGLNWLDVYCTHTRDPNTRLALSEPTRRLRGAHVREVQGHCPGLNEE